MALEPNPRKPYAVASLIMLVSSPVAGGAPAPQNDWYFAPLVSYTAGDSFNPDGQPGGPAGEEGFGGSLFFGKRISPVFNIEFGGTWRSLNVDDTIGNDIDQYGIQFDGLFFLNRSARFAPFVLVGAGAIDLDEAAKNYTLFADAGIGFVSRLGDSYDAASLRFDVRYIVEQNDSISLNDNTAHLGIHIPIGSVPVIASTRVDSDRDGVPNDQDSCPATPATADVDTRGCEFDTDNDGVVERLDACPATPQGATVNNRGCEPDSDQDGIPDGREACPNTRPGAQVDIHGCEIE